MKSLSSTSSEFLDSCYVGEWKHTESIDIVTCIEFLTSEKEFQEFVKYYLSYRILCSFISIFWRVANDKRCVAASLSFDEMGKQD